MGEGNLDIQNFSTYSQNFSYEINNNLSVGFEMGLNDIRYQTTQTVMIPLETSVVGDGVEILDPAFELQIPLDVTVERNFQNFWGSIYLENRLSLIDNFYLNSRAGAGLSGGDWMILAKLNIEYEVVSGISMLIGAETRTVNMSLPLALIDQQRVVTFGLNYGIKFNL